MELLISAVNANVHELVEKMNIGTDAVLVNQASCDEEETIEKSSYTVRVYTRNERGVGRSRNLCLEKSTDEIVLFSDEDIVYKEGYNRMVTDAFEKHPEADILLFNVEVCPERRTYWNEKYKKIGLMNLGRYPAYSIAARRKPLMESGVRYSLLFGGGAPYSNGEDSLFLADCCRAGLKIYACTDDIGCEQPRQSTWFNGYTEKFFFDRGVLFYFLYRHAAALWALRFVLVKKEMFNDGIKRKEAWKLILKGIKKGKEEIKKQNNKTKK